MDPSENKNQACPSEFVAPLMSMAQSIWTIRKKLGGQTIDSEGVQVHVDEVIDALKRLGVEIEEFANQHYRPGLNVDILVFQPDETVKQDTIKSTIRPAVFIDGKMLQRGQVIVSTPVTE